MLPSPQKVNAATSRAELRREAWRSRALELLTPPLQLRPRPLERGVAPRLQRCCRRRALEPARPHVQRAGQLPCSRSRTCMHGGPCRAAAGLALHGAGPRGRRRVRRRSGKAGRREGPLPGEPPPGAKLWPVPRPRRAQPRPLRRRRRRRRRRLALGCRRRDRREGCGGRGRGGGGGTGAWLEGGARGRAGGGRGGRGGSRGGEGGRRGNAAR